ncbi:glycosyltransferase family 4 protein [Persicitalea sp.]|uniref:glycosyltransferase family 4 protein n=1 Tax=Persicitalea sp. TaxID=3100273 RepID=UPI003593F529
MERKKILFLSPRPNLGGASQVLLNLLDSTKGANAFEASFLFEETGVALPEYQQYGIAHIFPLERNYLLRKVAKKLSVRLYDVAKHWYARWVIKTQSPQIIYINSLVSSPSVRTALRSSAHITLHAHEMDFLVVFKLPDAWIRKTLERVDRLIVCSTAVATFYENTFEVLPTKISVIHGPVSSRRLHKGMKASPPIPKRDKGAIVLGTVANLSFLKAPDVIIEALFILINQFTGTKEVKLQWLGAPAKPNPHLSSLLALVKKRGLEDYISFLPATDKTDLFYSQIDIFVLPSRMEAFPLSIMEAMLFEKPVVAMDVGGVREVVDTETGYLVKDRTPEGLAKGILYFLENEDRRNRAGQAGRKRVLEKFESSVQAPKWLDILENT